MSKSLVGQINPALPALPLPSPDAEAPTKTFVTSIKGDKGDPGEIDPDEVELIVDEYLDENPPGLYVETFIQSSPAAVWTINHSLPFQPAVTVIDSAGTRIETEIQYLSNTQIRSVASAAFSGTAYLS